MVMKKYHQVTHQGGKVCVRDRYVLRKLTDSLKVDVDVVKTFSLLASPHHFHSDDLDKVFSKYLSRVETMVGNEVSRHLVESILVSGVDRLESLRQAKQECKRKVKTDEESCSKLEPAKRSRPPRKKYRRKKKKW